MKVCTQDDKLELIQHLPILATQENITMIGLWTENVTYCKRKEDTYESVISINESSCYLNFEKDHKNKFVKPNSVEHSLVSCFDKYN